MFIMAIFYFLEELFYQNLGMKNFKKKKIMLQIYVCTLERDREIFCPLVYSTNACSKRQPGARNSIQTPTSVTGTHELHSLLSQGAW